MAKYSISEEAIRDLDEISDYFALQSLEAGESFIRRFADKCRNLVNFPNMGRSYTEIMPNLRGIPLDNYIILYQVIKEEIEIVRVVSGYRDLGILFDDHE
ncbi:type II toxin-antitoxin system RelE/ParE family toxin [Aphanothece sacrum]|uniref:Plasmid stabilization system n=1 Tax=Aphanothece sacrum FPU1 TaxID=1920663 RepID=A0A401IE43_APHSA|nr:type II toxin-antitoxin system RelE/ParE family toxin [Aphanothece sacrum]GBF79548.1 plasmid stabilization system [Aphanothece sacrum FPU1]GBF86288.1 plasmid stabilization protein [Aphanothece sacrum FPU3]